MAMMWSKQIKAFGTTRFKVQKGYYYTGIRFTKRKI